MKNKIVFITIVVMVALGGVMTGSLTVVGQSSAAEMYLTPSDISLDEGESETIDIKYDSGSGESPSSLEFRLEHNPQVITVTDYELGEHVNNQGGSVIIDPDAFRFGHQIDQDQIESDEFTVATITVELKDGVDQGDETDLIFNEVTAFGTQNPETSRGIVTATEGTPEAVGIDNPTLEPSEVNESSVTHTLKFDLNDVSADGGESGEDVVTIKLPNDVAIEDITETTVTEQETGDEVELASNDPADESNLGNEITFAVNPESDNTDIKDLSVKINIILSPSA